VPTLLERIFTVRLTKRYITTSTKKEASNFADSNFAGSKPATATLPGRADFASAFA
jgi:hypothetical protein